MREMQLKPRISLNLIIGRCFYDKRTTLSSPTKKISVQKYKIFRLKLNNGSNDICYTFSYTYPYLSYISRIKR